MRTSGLCFRVASMQCLRCHCESCSRSYWSQFQGDLRVFPAMIKMAFCRLCHHFLWQFSCGDAHIYGGGSSTFSFIPRPPSPCLARFLSTSAIVWRGEARVRGPHKKKEWILSCQDLCVVFCCTKREWQTVSLCYCFVVFFRKFELNYLLINSWLCFLNEGDNVGTLKLWIAAIRVFLFLMLLFIVIIIFLT